MSCPVVAFVRKEIRKQKQKEQEEKDNAMAVALNDAVLILCVVCHAVGEMHTQSPIIGTEHLASCLSS